MIDTEEIEDGVLDIRITKKPGLVAGPVGEAIDAGKAPPAVPIRVEPNPLPQNLGSLDHEEAQYKKKWGAHSEDVRDYLNGLPREEQLFVYRLAHRQGLRLEDIGTELLIAKELHAMSLKAVASLEYAIGREEKELAGLVVRQEELFTTMRRQISAANERLDGTLNSVLACVAQALEALDKRSQEVEKLGVDAVASVRASIQPESLAREVVQKEAEEAASLFYRKLSKEIKTIARSEAKQEVDQAWRKKGWVNNAIWLCFSAGMFVVGVVLK